MKTLLRITALALTLTASSLFAAVSSSPGYAELGAFKPTEGCQFVEVNLHASLLKFAATFVDKEDPAAAELIRALEHVHVNVVGYNDQSRADTTQHVQSIRRDLENQGWQRAVTVQQGGKDADVAVYVKSGDNDSIVGLVVTVIDSNEKNAVVVNLVGNIKPEQLAAVGKSLHIDPLAHLNLKAVGKGV